MEIERIGVVGAGTMGAGIAQIACLGGLETWFHDPQPEALEAGRERLRADLEKGTTRGRWTDEEAQAAVRRLHPAADLEALGGCELVIEAAPEDLDLKRRLFSSLARACGP
jgi:3-hydroxybutyryl-CoA dehydrogenase